MGKNVHVVYESGIWKVKQENAGHSSGNFSTQEEAFERAREIARNYGQEVILHKKDGSISRKYSYGNDPYPPKGQLIVP